MPTTRAQTAALTLAGVVAATVFTSSCGASHNDSGSDKGRQVATQAMPLPDAKIRSTWPKAEVEQGLAKGMRLPLEDYMLAYADVVDVENARDVVRQQCMQRLNFKFTPEPSGLRPASAYDSMNMKRRYGITDRTEAAAHGFALPQAGTEDDTASEDAELAREDSESSVPGWDQAMNETCIPEANAKVGILYETDLAGDLASASYDATAKQTSVKNAVATWSSCMAGDGHQVKSLDDTEGRFAKPQLSGLKPGRAEVSMATDDIDCKQTSRLVSTWYTAETAYQLKQIASHKHELTAERNRNKKLIEKTRAVLTARR
ncbi:hypothetical protein OHB33_40645 (plasmid) [Streptomyces sp. NBC_01558]|uniref:hypothetical protein n=1 Tax=Streptomyces sp. NBC_01558 TaxID=2975878 RepID=UPI002DD935A0|nr:hypothetical protein [Streptomyces sp. NBC_01558]WSD82700.1 hypothetical protein OHB33_40645 [Streptomyces sp. NBC_01558]